MYTTTGRGARLSPWLAARPILPTYAKALRSPSVSEIACTWLLRVRYFRGFIRNQRPLAVIKCLEHSSALPLKGKQILAVILATALLAFLETPWLQPSFNHSNILFFEALQDGELPDITKLFLAMEHIPLASAGKTGTGVSSDSSKHMVHPNASVLALGILLRGLHYCTPVELMQKYSLGARNVNSDYYTSLDMLKILEVDAGVDYYLATKACLQWEYYPPGQQADFESVDVQRLFYQNVVKRLEAEIFRSWGLRIENLGSFDPRQNELCWGSIGQEVVRHQTGKADPSDTNNGALGTSVSFVGTHCFYHTLAMLSLLKPRDERVCL